MVILRVVACTIAAFFAMVILRAWSAWSTSNFSTGFTSRSVWLLLSTRVELDQFLFRWTELYNHPFVSKQNWWHFCNGHFACLISLIKHPASAPDVLLCYFYIQLALNLISFCTDGRSCIIIHMVARKIDDFVALVILHARSAWSTYNFSTGCTSRSLWLLHSTRVELDQWLLHSTRVELD